MTEEEVDHVEQQRAMDEELSRQRRLFNMPDTPFVTKASIAEQ